MLFNPDCQKMNRLGSFVVDVNENKITPDGPQDLASKAWCQY